MISYTFFFSPQTLALLARFEQKIYSAKEGQTNDDGGIDDDEEESSEAGGWYVWLFVEMSIIFVWTIKTFDPSIEMSVNFTWLIKDLFKYKIVFCCSIILWLFVFSLIVFCFEMNYRVIPIRTTWFKTMVVEDNITFITNMMHFGRRGLPREIISFSKIIELLSVPSKHLIFP